MNLTKARTCSCCGGQMSVAGLDEEGRLIYECAVCNYQEQSAPLDLADIGLVSNSHADEEVLLAIAYGEKLWRLDADNRARDILIGNREEVAASALEQNDASDQPRPLDQGTGLPQGYHLIEADWV